MFLISSFVIFYFVFVLCCHTK